MPSGCGTVGMKSGLSRRNRDGWTVCHTIIENNRFSMRLDNGLHTHEKLKQGCHGWSELREGKFCCAPTVLPLEYGLSRAMLLQLCNNDVGAKDQKGIGIGIGTPACVRRVINYGWARARDDHTRL